MKRFFNDIKKVNLKYALIVQVEFLLEYLIENDCPWKSPIITFFEMFRNFEYEEKYKK